MFYLADQTDKVSLKGFRAYINVDSESPVAGVNRLLIDIDGAVTSVGEVLDNRRKMAERWLMCLL